MERRRRPTQVVLPTQPESPTVVDRAVARLAQVTETARAEQRAKDLEVMARGNPAGAANLAYELGELYERRLDNEARAVELYRRALELDASHRPNVWALRRVLLRRAEWPELGKLLDVELDHASSDQDRVELLLERAVTADRRDSSGAEARAAVDAALKIAPDHQGALLELERVIARTGDSSALLEIWERLAGAIHQPERKIAYWLEIARSTAGRDPGQAQRALEAAAALATTPRSGRAPRLTPQVLAERVARERLRIADEHGTPDQVGAAIDALVQVMAAGLGPDRPVNESEVTLPSEHPQRALARQRELVALRRRQAQMVRSEQPQRAWEHLQQALALAPEEPVVIVDLIELGRELGHHTEFPRLVHIWRAVESDAGRAMMLSFWCAEAHLFADRRERIRALVRSLESTVPGFLLLTSTAECDALADPSRVRSQLDLAGTYLSAARAAALGTWLGPRSSPRPDPNAAAALYVQAAQLFAYFVGTLAALDQARDALAKALEAAPSHPAVLEALIELDDTTGRPEPALRRLRELAATAQDSRPILERAIRLASSHGLPEAVLELERDLVKREPSDIVLAWRLEATLSQLGRSDERAELLGRLAREDPDPARRRTALLRAARLHERAGAADEAMDHYRQLRALWPEQLAMRDALLDLLRAQQRWAELVTERRAEARASSGGPALRRALREAAWVLEIWLDDVAQAASVYQEWLARLPGDRTALEGVARASTTLGDHAGEVAARAAIAALDDTPEARWLYASSLERAARYDEAAEQYRGLVTGEDPSVAATSAALSLGDLAARGARIEMRAFAGDALARRTTDPRLGAALFEDSGWIYLALADTERAGQALAAALALEPARRGALLGAALVAACQAERIRQGELYVALAAAVQMPEAAVALLLRAAAIASATGDAELASQRVEAARVAAPDNVYALFVAAEVGLPKPIDPADPFAAGDQLIAHAELLEKRGALAGDPESRTPWELDWAEALELAGQLREASAVLAAVLQDRPDNRRAISAVRRIAQRAGDRVIGAQASYALARLCHDPGFQLQLLREAVEVYDRPGPPHNADYAIAIYRRIVALDPKARERERLLEIARERGDTSTQIAAQTDRLTWLSAHASPGEADDEASMIALLLERASLLRVLGRHDKAAIDLDAVLEHAPRHGEALRLRADLAHDVGDVERAITLWLTYLAVEPDDAQRANIELLLARALEGNAVSPPPPEPLVGLADGTEQTTAVRPIEIQDPQNWEPDPTKPYASALSGGPVPPRSRPKGTPMPEPDPGKHRGPPSMRRMGAPATAGTAPTQIIPQADPFAGATVLTDLSELQEQERQVAQEAALATPQDYEVEIISDTVRRAVESTLHPGRITPRGNSPAPMPTDVAVHSAIAVAVGASDQDDTSQTPDRKLRPPALDLAELSGAPGNAELEPELDTGAIRIPEKPPLSLDDSEVVMLSFDELQPAKSDDTSRDMLLQYEREIAMAGDPASAAPLRLEAGRLSELLGDTGRAHAHYDAALVADRRATAAMRGLRRSARATGDLVEMIRLVDAELAVAGALEREALARYRIDLLMATGEQDIARVAAGELLDRAPLDIPALLAHLELALLDNRGDEFRRALEMLAEAVTDPALRGAMQVARDVLAAHHGNATAAAAWPTATAEVDPGSSATRLAAIGHAVAQGQGAAAGVALLDLACRIETEDPVTAAALAVRAQLWTAGAPGADRQTMAEAAQLAARAAPRDPLVARIAAETALVAGDPTIASHAFARWARCAGTPVERAYAAARAAELEPTRLGRLWAKVLENDPGDDYAVARVRAAHVASGEMWRAIEFDVQLAQDTQRDWPLLRAASELCSLRQIDAAIDVLSRGHEQRPESDAIAEALADAFAEAGRWSDRAKLAGELATAPGGLARDVARVRSALAWDKLARAAAADRTLSRDEQKRMTSAALEAWTLVLEDDPQSPVAHAARFVLAKQLDHTNTLFDVLTGTQAQERSPWAASSLSLRRARLMATNDPQLAQDIARRSAPGLDDPRSTLVVMMAAAHRHKLGEAVTALEERAKLLEAAPAGSEPNVEPATLRLRAAQLALDASDPARATKLLARVALALPGLADDLIDVARRRAGEPPPVAPPPVKADSFVRILRDAELAAARGHHAAALVLYQRALEIRTGDPLAAAPLVRIATALRDPLPISTLALEQLRAAVAGADPLGKALGYELLARADELRGDTTSMQLALEAALEADPDRSDLVHRLERMFSASGRYSELLHLRERQLDQWRRSSAEPGRGSPAGGAQDLAALTMDAAVLAVRAERPEPVLAKLYRAALEADPHSRRALFHTAALVGRAGASEELAALEGQLAEAFDDPRSKAAFLTRAGKTLAQLGKPAVAVQRFAQAAKAFTGYLPALEAWRETALTHELWRELAEVTTHAANKTSEPKAAASLHHFTGVVLMDKLAAHEPAIAALRRAMELDPSHTDAFVRLRGLLEDTANPGELAALLGKRLEGEPDPAAQIELRRMLAEHWSNTGDREAAMQQYRALLRIDPADVRAHAAIADIASEQSNWQAAAAAVTARIPLETDPQLLRTLHYRLGVIYAEHDVPAALAAFQRALTYKPGDVDALVRLADLAITAGEWQVALDTCDQLVTVVRDPEKRALHLHRAATIFARGFHDQKRAERMLHLAFESAPTSTECLRLIVAFYKDAGDMMSLRIQLDRIAAVMRLRVTQDVKDGAAYRVLARAIMARAEHLADGSLPIARAAAELAQLLGAGGDLEQHLLATPPPSDLARLTGPGATERMVSHSKHPKLLQILRLVANPISKHTGTDLGVHGVSRKDRLPSSDPIAAAVRDIATSLGQRTIDVYVSSRHPYLMVAEPTNPVSIVLGSAIAGDPLALKFAAGAVLKLAHMSLAIPARLPPGELGVLGLALLRLFQPELAAPGVDLDEVNAQVPKLRRLVPPALFDEVKPLALAVKQFDPEALVRDLKIAGLRAGLIASGSLLPGLAILTATEGADPAGTLADPIAQELISFALSEDRVAAAR